MAGGGAARRSMRRRPAARRRCTNWITTRPSATRGSSCRTNKRSSATGELEALLCWRHTGAVSSALGCCPSSGACLAPLPSSAHLPVLVRLCRERRKQRFQELELALNVLTDQMQAKQFEIAGLQNQNATLHVRGPPYHAAARDKRIPYAACLQHEPVGLVPDHHGCMQAHLASLLNTITSCVLMPIPEQQSKAEELSEALRTHKHLSKQFDMQHLYCQQGKAKELSDAMSAKDAELAALRAQLAAAFNGGAPSSSDGHSSGTAGNQPHEAEVQKALTQSIVSPALSCPLLLHLLSMCPCTQRPPNTHVNI